MNHHMIHNIASSNPICLLIYRSNLMINLLTPDEVRPNLDHLIGRIMEITELDEVNELQLDPTGVDSS